MLKNKWLYAGMFLFLFPMRIALANRYFEEFNYSSALPHFMYVAQNSEDLELKSLALSQIGWMVHDSGDTATSLNYIEEALTLSLIHI